MSFEDRFENRELDKAAIEQLIATSDCCVLLDNAANQENDAFNGPLRFSRLMGLGVKQEFLGSDADSLDKLKDWLQAAGDYVMGYFSYDAKNLLEDLSSENEDSIEFQSFYFFVPETLVIENEGLFTILTHDKNLSSRILPVDKCSNGELKLETIEREDYIHAVNNLRQHIQLGDIYEVNYCVEHRFENTHVNPYPLYTELQRNSPAPFSCFLAHNEKFLMSSSPERFMMNKSGRLVSQPMKGTNRKVPNNQIQKDNLAADTKERAENIMITDLVRNDLSRSAKKGTVKVEELCGVYEFEHVNQMISTVSAQLEDDLHPLDALLSAFPMGSMTGAPKIRAMELIDKVEDFSRGLYSGSVGYFTPDLDFDFNVIIRSILYNAEKQRVTFPTGSAITINSDPEKEYEEMILKAEAMQEVILKHA